MLANVDASKLSNREGGMGYNVLGSPKAMEFDDVTLCNDVTDLTKYGELRATFPRKAAYLCVI